MMVRIILASIMVCGTVTAVAGLVGMVQTWPW